MSRCKVAIDIGGTIEDTWEYKRNWFMQKGYDIGSSPIGRREIISITQRDTNFYLEMVKDVYSDDSIIEHKLVEGVKEALQNISKIVDITLLSSRNYTKKELTLKWIKNNDLYQYINNLVFIGDEGNKIEWCSKHAIDILIDDDIRHLAPKNYNLKFERILFNSSKITLKNNNNPKFKTYSMWKDIADYIQLKM